MKAFPTPIDVSPATADGTYQTVDLTTHIDAGDQGDVALAVFEVRNTVGTEHNHGIRPTGPLGWSRVLFFPIWGGQGLVLTQDNFLRFDHYRVSGR